MMRRHRIATEMLTEFATGGGGVAGIRTLATLGHSRNRMLAGLLPELAVRAGHPQAMATRDAYQLLADVETHDPAAVRDVLCYPAVGAWLGRTVGALAGHGRSRAGRPTSPGLLALVAVTAAVRAGAPAQLRLPASIGRDQLLILPSLGVAALPGAEADPVRVQVDVDGRVVLCRAGHRIRLPAVGQLSMSTASPMAEPTEPGWAALPRVTLPVAATCLDVVLDGSSWQALGNAGPPVAGEQHLDLREWQAGVRAGWLLLAEHHPAVAAETAEGVRVLVPLHTSSQDAASASFPGAFGALAMSPPADGRSVALTFTHELQHAKLLALMDALPLVLPAGDDSRYYALWRDDLRPLTAFLHGAYAHLGVAAFWRRQQLVETEPFRIHAAQVQFVLWRDAVRDALQVIGATDRLTPSGELLVDGMRSTIEAFGQETVPAAARCEAERLARRHRRRAGVG